MQRMHSGIPIHIFQRPGQDLQMFRAFRASALVLLLSLVGCTGGGGGGDSAPDSPEGVTASDGVSSDWVAVTWTAVEGADSYRVYRDGTMIAELAGVSYQDVGAATPGVPLAPADFAATDGNSDADVALSWSAAAVPDG